MNIKIDYNTPNKLQELNSDTINDAEILSNIIGFRGIIDCIIDNKIPILTHNGLLDLMHV